MLSAVFATDDGWTGFLLRVTVGGIMFAHGGQKLLGWFNGPGFDGIMTWLMQTKHLPWIVAFGVVMVEFLGSLMLLVGLGTRFWAVAMIGLMIGIIVTSHMQQGFFMNWNGEPRPEGFEYHLLVIGISLAAMVAGGGRFSLDRYLIRP